MMNTIITFTIYLPQNKAQFSGRANRSICRLGLKAPSDSHPDRETRGPYAANPAILDQSRGPDLRVRPCAFLNAPAPFARSTSGASETTCARKSAATVCL